MFLLFASLLGTAPLLGAEVPVFEANVAEQYLKIAADQERAQLGLPPLRWDAVLSAAAHHHAAMMASKNSISHQYPEEPDLSSRAADVGAKFSLITENVAQAPNAVIIHAAWMRSEGHRHNLLDSKVDTVGIAVVSRDGQMFAVEDFARSVATLTTPQQESMLARTVAPYGLTILPTSSQAREVCAGSAILGMDGPPAFVMRYTTDDLQRLPSDLTLSLKSGQYASAVVAACEINHDEKFSMYRVAVLLYRR